MPASWKKKPGCDLTRLCCELEALRNVDSSGKASFSGSEMFDDCLELLTNALKPTAALPKRQLRKMIFPSICDVGDAPLTPATVLQSVIKREKAYLAQPSTVYFLATELTIPFHPKLRSLRVSGHAFSFRPKRPSAFELPEEMRRRFPGRAKSNGPAVRKCWLRVRTAGRTPFDAGEDAIDAICLLRGFWNLFLTVGDRTRSFGHPVIVNQVIAGPIHTLHREDGTLAVDSFWYEQQFAPRTFPLSIENDWDELEKTRRHWQKLLRSRPEEYRRSLEMGLRRYAVALDHVDHEATFLKLWGVLEQLTGTAHARYQDTIRRATFLWRDRQHCKDVLNCLRERRNRQVHENTFVGDPEESVYSLKRFVDRLLLFHLNSRFGFRSIAEATELLDLPEGSAQLRRRRDIIDEALAWGQGRKRKR